MNIGPCREGLRNLFKLHGIVLPLAIIVGTLCVAPHIYARFTIPSYAGIHMTGSDSEEHYESRIQEVRDGFPAVGDTYLPDKTVRPIEPALAENIMAFLADFLQLPTADFSEYSKFAFPFIATLFMYAFGYFLLRSRAAAFIGAATVLLGDNLVSGPSAWKAFVYGGAYVTDFMTYSRTINPEFSGILFFASLALVVRAFFSNRAPRWYEGAGIGILVGIAFYPSPYVASFVLCLVAIAGVVSIYKREWAYAFAALFAGITALVCLIPFFLNYSEVVKSPLYADAAARFGEIPSHTPVLGTWVFIMLLAAIFAVPKQFAQARSFFLYSAIALIILLNQQVLTGHVLVSEHFHWYITKPLISFLIAMYAVYIAQSIFRKRVYLYYGFYVLCIGLLMVNAAEVQAVSFKSQEAAFINAQRYAPIMNFLNTLPQRELIWADYAMSELIPIYTSHDTANNRQMTNYLIPTRYLEQELFFQYRLRDISATDAPARMENERGEVSATVYGIRWRQVFGSYEAIPEPLLQAEIQKYQSLNAVSTSDLAKSMGITLIIWDKDLDPAWHMEALPAKSELFEDKDIVVYRLANSTVTK